jgi:hypothetical protein
MIKKLYIDMDGVICDFERRYNELYHSNPEVCFPDSASNNQKKKQYLKYWNEFVEGGNFATLDPMPDWDNGFGYLWSLSIETNLKIYVLTSTARSEYFEILATHKMNWLRENDIDFEPIFVPGKRFKKIYAAPDSILVDDTKKNYYDWVANGGIGILHENWEKTINSLEKILFEDSGYCPSALGKY